ncbi:hypothetical protein F5Y09DRAFT_313591 [Xylaria sp. FL1042]|nr:hypothetical protein F5Y09DRAFT_313591 [Xylaria sp. FL1042]
MPLVGTFALYLCFCIQMLKCWYGSLRDWRFWHPKLEYFMPRLPNHTETSRGMPYKTWTR